jgi:hypothetical protein
MTELAASSATGRKVEKITAWTRELFPGSFGEGYKLTECHWALEFYNAVNEALAPIDIFTPEIMKGLEIDQVEDVVIYYGLQKALANRQQRYYRGIPINMP